MKTLLFLLIGIWLLVPGPPDKVRILLAGDSTMSLKPLDTPERGWGQALPAFFDTSRVSIENFAKNGRSTRTFLSEGLWDSLMQRVRPGDYVFIQFGHNDGSEHKVDRYTDPDTYAANLRRFAEDVLGRGGHPVLCTPLMRRRFDEAGHLYDTHGVYPDRVRALAQALGLPLLDLHQTSRLLIEAHGPEGSKRLFLWYRPGEIAAYPDGKSDDTHFSPYGAYCMAGLAVAAMSNQQLPLVAYVKNP